MDPIKTTGLHVDPRYEEMVGMPVGTIYDGLIDQIHNAISTIENKTDLIQNLEVSKTIESEETVSRTKLERQLKIVRDRLENLSQIISV